MLGPIFSRLQWLANIYATQRCKGVRNQPMRMTDEYLLGKHCKDHSILSPDPIAIMTIDLVLCRFISI